MNLPSGKPFKTNLDVASTEVMKLLDELRGKRFTGYLALCVKGQRGIEEATLFADAGKIVGAVYEYYAYNKQYAGEKAFQRFLNAMAAKHGVIDLFETTQDQLHLILAFNEDAVFVPREETIRRVKVAEFSPFFEEEVRKEAAAQTSTMDASRKYKVYSLMQEEPKPERHELPKPEEKT